MTLKKEVAAMKRRQKAQQKFEKALAERRHELRLEMSLQDARLRPW